MGYRPFTQKAFVLEISEKLTEKGEKGPEKQKK